MIKHRIDLTIQYIIPINSGPHPARPKAREFKNTEFDKILLMNVIEPAQSE